MSIAPPVFDLQTLEGEERGLREQLRTQPEDMNLRLRLAWCLLLEALHRAGQEAALRTLTAIVSSDSANTNCVLNLPLDRNAQRMLSDCLDEAYTVLHLSDQDEAHRDVAKIHALVQLSGAHSFVAESETRAIHHFTHLFNALCSPEETEDIAE